MSWQAGTNPSRLGGLGGPWGGTAKSFSTTEGSGLSYLVEPPSLAAISDANVVVGFKNLQKKDPTTKSKALDELLHFAESHPHDVDGGVEDAVIEAWVQVYPRVSIDNSRRVRELSHKLQLALMKSARKRMERRVPKVIGAWLGGTHDKDRIVSRASREGLQSFLTTPEKTTAFMAKCQGPVLEFALAAIRETPDSLSDERSTTRDDSEAKYYRVVAASLALVLGLLQQLGDSVISKVQEKYDEFLAEEKVWKSAAFGDPAVRKSACQLLVACMDKQQPPPPSRMALLKRAFLVDAFKVSQAGSAVDLIGAISALTKKRPDIWVVDGSKPEKKTPFSRLLAFVERGSQGTSGMYWEHLDSLMSEIPTEVLTPSIATSSLTSIRVGLNSKADPKSHSTFAWSCYLKATKRYLALFENDATRQELAREHVLPLLRQYLFPSVDLADWSIESRPVSVLSSAYFLLAHVPSVKVREGFGEELQSLSRQLGAAVSACLPEVSRDFEKSQEEASATGRRWFDWVAGVLKNQAAGKSATDYTKEPSLAIISQCIQLVKSRNFKPFGAASILDLTGRCATHLWDDGVGAPVPNFLRSLSQSEIQLAVQSRSGTHLLSCVNALGTIESQKQTHETVWIEWIDAVLAMAPSKARTTALVALASHHAALSFAQSKGTLQSSLVDACLSAVKGEEDAWSLLETAVRFSVLSDASISQVVSGILGILEAGNGPIQEAVRGLGIIANEQPSILSRDQGTHTALLAALLRLTEVSNGDVGSNVASIRAALDHHSPGRFPVLGIVMANLEKAHPQSLEIQTLVQQARLGSKSAAVSAIDLYPPTQAWMSALSFAFRKDPNPSLSVTSNLSGAYFFCKSPEAGTTTAVARDSSGRSVPARMALYVAAMLEQETHPPLPLAAHVSLLQALFLTAALASDQVTMMSSDGLWRDLTRSTSLESATHLVSVSNKIMTSMLATDTSWRDGNGASVTLSVIASLNERAKELNSVGLYNAKVLQHVLQTLTELHGLPRMDKRMKDMDVWKLAPQNILPAIAVVGGHGEILRSSQTINTFLNRLVSDIVGAHPGEQKALWMLTLLTACIKNHVGEPIPVAQNRLVFAVKHVTGWIRDPSQLDPLFSAELCRFLQYMLPFVKNIYDTFWESTLEFCMWLWANESVHEPDVSIPYIDASVRLFSTLESIEEPNDDLADALAQYAEKKSQALIELLKVERGFESQPIAILNGLLCRQVAKIPLHHLKDVTGIYHLLASDSREIQTAAFTLLHRVIPAVQGEESVEVLLENRDARLSDELLSLLLDAPSLEKYPDDILSRFPVPVRGYLLTWHIVFDAFSAAALKIRNDYTEHLKRESLVGPLLEFLTDVLGHTVGKPLQLSKHSLTTDKIKQYDLSLADAEPEEQNMQWLLVHLYYCVLKHVPGLFKTWYLDLNKQTKSATETWTTKYFSPIIISETLDEISNWAANQDLGSDEDQELVVKVSRAGREVTAGYEVDESLASIAIKIPEEYPISGVAVEGLNRVAVSDNKWQAWLMTTRGVITFSNGSIIDGLSTFRRNIVGALKGQSECAICYSIISSDKKMPDKACQTCKNLFHRTCLYKWFQTSSQNTCPLCRNPISYLGSDARGRRGGG